MLPPFFFLALILNISMSMCMTLVKGIIKMTAIKWNLAVTDLEKTNNLTKADFA